MTVKGNIEAFCPVNAVISSAAISTNIFYITLYNFLSNLSSIGVTKIAFNVGSKDLGVAWQLGTPRADIKPAGRR